jgi:cbb3-type cytochrome oxidase maturation protein
MAGTPLVSSLAKDPTMSVLMLLIPLSVLIAACFLAAFFWAVRSGQYEDTCTPALRILTDDAPSAIALPVAKPEQVLPSPGEPLRTPTPEIQNALNASLRRSPEPPV